MLFSYLLILVVFILTIVSLISGWIILLGVAELIVIVYTMKYFICKAKQ
jgi:hypothetical protein